MTINKITTIDFWAEYWSNFKPKRMKKQQFFSDLLADFPGQHSTFIEIGGFPGNFSAYFKKYKNYDVTLLDYYTIPKIVKDVERINSIKSNSIKLIEEDFFEYQTEKKYDVVFSAGFIEHFDNTELVLEKHYDLLENDGILFISMPNFRGLNGLVQYIFDKSNYDAHNIAAMDITNLRNICKSLNMVQFDVFYHGTPCLWLEKTANVNKCIRGAVAILSIILFFIRIKNRVVSPYIVIKAKKEI